MHSRSKRLVAGAINPRARALDADGRIRATSLSLSWCSAKAKAMMAMAQHCDEPTVSGAGHDRIKGTSSVSEIPVFSTSSSSSVSLPSPPLSLSFRLAATNRTILAIAWRSGTEK